MSHVFEGEEWKYQKPERPKHPTRSERQAKLNADYATGIICLDWWRRETDHLSNCRADGSVFGGKKKV